MVVPNFINMETAIKAYNRNADCCGAPAWRFVYHVLHSADKWFFNPFEYDEPTFHQNGMDNPDNMCSVILSDEQLLEYLAKIKKRLWLTYIHLQMICFMKTSGIVHIQD